MKKALSILLAVTMIFCFAACSKSTNETKENKETTSANSSNKENTNKEKDTTNSTSSNKNSSSDGTSYFNNEIKTAPKGAVVIKDLKAKKCTAKIQTLPTDVSANYVLSLKEKSKSTITKCSYTFDDSKDGKVTLNLKITGKKISDKENGTLSSAFLIRVFDSKNNVVGECNARTQMLQNGSEFEYECSIGGLTDTSYAVAFTNSIS